METSFIIDVDAMSRDCRAIDALVLLVYENSPDGLME